MSRVAALVSLAASALFASTAWAESPAPKLEKKPLVWFQAYSSVQTVYEDAPPSTPEREGSLRPGADIGMRLAVGQGKWTSDARVLPGLACDCGKLERGYAIGLWMRHASASPTLQEHLGVSYGLSATTLDKTERGLLMASTFEVGGRLRMDDQGRVRSDQAAPLGQVQVGISQQVMLFHSFLLGPAVSIDIGNAVAPWAVATGLRVSSIL